MKLRKFPNDNPSRFPKSLILEGKDFILKNNSFYFNGKSYRQSKGMAMGTKFAPANSLFRGKINKQINEKYGSQYTNEFIKMVSLMTASTMNQIKVRIIRAKRYVE